MLVCVKIRAKLCSKLIRAIYWLTLDRLAAYLQSGSFFQLVGIPILYTGIDIVRGRWFIVIKKATRQQFYGMLTGSVI